MELVSSSSCFYVWKLSPELEVMSKHDLLPILFKETGKAIAAEEKEKVLTHQLIIHYNFIPKHVITNLMAASDDMMKPEGQFLVSFMFGTEGFLASMPNSELI